MSALTEAPWHELRLGHVEVAIHPDVFGDAFGNDIDPRTDGDIQKGILIMVDAAVGKLSGGRRGIQWANVERARLRRPTQTERLYLLEVVQRDREADGLRPPAEKNRRGKMPRIVDFVLELDYCRQRPSRSRDGKKKKKEPRETTFFGILWPEGKGQSMIYILPTEEVEPEIAE